MKQTQMEFDFESTLYPQEFKGKTKVIFGDPWYDGKPEYDYYIKKNHYSSGPKSLFGVWRRTYASVEVDWDYIMYASKEEADELVKAGYAKYW